MPDYGDSINIYEFKYSKPVYYNSNYDEFKSSIIVKLLLTGQNFNFDLANTDGSDFRLMDEGGFNVFKMWVAYWSVSSNLAVLFFKIPNVNIGDSYTFQAYWGNSDATNVSDPASMGFLFYEDFPDDTLSASKWTGELNAGSSEYGYLFPRDATFTTITNPIENKNSWIIEAGVYTDFSIVTTDPYVLEKRIFGFGFEGTENDFYVDFRQVSRIRTNLVEAGGTTITDIDGTYIGAEPNSYQEVHIHYYEPTDAVTIKLQYRSTYEDTSTDLGRKVEGDTRPKNISVRGYYGPGGTTVAPHPTYINWLAVREYSEGSLDLLDGSELYIPYENVPAQNQDFREFNADLTSILYQHESSFGGDPYKLSDEGYDSNTNVWISDDNASISGCNLTIHTAWSEDLTSRTYKHYDSGHVYYYNASKLSTESDFNGRNFWHCTTTSGWAAIKFPTSKVIGAFRIKSTDDLDAVPKTFDFYGSNYNPTIFFSRAKKIISGTFEDTAVWQSRVLNSSNKYRYYILDIKDTHGDENIKIQEWEMMLDIEETEKRYPTQLRLHPALYGDYEYNFPKTITLAGSLDGVNWVTLIPQTSTYTPFVEHNGSQWQHYSFDNEAGFYSFRVTVSGNWGAADNKIIIGEWSLHELASESYTYRILAGENNDIQQIWATINAGINDNNALIYIANEKINKVLNDKLVGSEELPDYYEDFNIV
jgi:hypothetical protein